MGYSEQYIAQLLLKHFRDEITPVEMEDLESWLSKSPQNRLFFEGLDNGEEIVRLIEIDKGDEENATAQKILLEIQNRIARQDIVSEPIMLNSYRRRKMWYAAAAAAAVVSMLFIWLQFEKPEQAQEVVVMQKAMDVLPGSDRAVLTLSNGQQVELNEDGSQVINDGELSIENNNGELVYASPDKAVFNTMTTPKGGQYKLTLSDGSKVWLNAASSITFPTRFDGDRREVKITGEVYFDVSENKKKPFIITTPRGSLEVLGTQFNVNTYEDESYETTTLVEGRVRVSNIAENVELTPGQQSRLAEHSNKISVDIADIEAVTGWRENLFIFNNVDIPAIMRQLSRWYDLELQFKGNVPKRPYKGKIPRDLKLNEVLSALKLAGVRLEVEGKTLFVSGVN